MSQKALEIAKKNDENSFFSFAYPYPIIMKYRENPMVY